MKLSKFLALAVAALTSLSALADGLYRNHVYDSFLGTPPASEPGTQTVFLGNSITNMHNWSEAFGLDPNIVNRGNSGGFAYEWIEQIESVLDSKPAKVFIGIGTNDNSQNTSVERAHVTARNILNIVARIKAESPTTEVYVQSILPRKDNPQFERNTLTNNLVKEKIEQYGAHFIDLTDVMMGVRTSWSNDPATAWACDGLHPTGRGYSAWCNTIKDYVNGKCDYPIEINYHPELKNVYNPSRVSQFCLLPCTSEDIMFLGDEVLENGKWSELLGVGNIRLRSNGYGYGGQGICGDVHMRDALGMLRASLETDPSRQQAPKKLFIYTGVNELAGDTTEVDFTARYQTLVNYIKQHCPNTKVYLMSLVPHGNAAKTTLTLAYNKIIKETFCDGDDQFTYVDVYTPLIEELGSNMANNYVYGRGYVLMAQAIAPFLAEEGAKAPTIAEYDQYRADRLARKSLGLQFNRVFAAAYTDENFGVELGQYNPSSRAAMLKLQRQIGDRLADYSAAPSSEEVNTYKALIDELLASSMNNDFAAEGRVFRLTSQRGNKSLTTQNGTLVGVVADNTTDGTDVWQFQTRPDGTFNIANLRGEYVAVGAAHDKAMSVSIEEPARGWQIDMSTAYPGKFIIYSTGSTDAERMELNQTSGANVFNWFGTNSFPNTTDDGCAYAITEFTGVYNAPAVDVNDIYADNTQYVVLSLASGYASSGNTGKKLALIEDGVFWGNGLYELEYTNPDNENLCVLRMVQNGNNASFQLPTGRYIMDDGRSQTAEVNISYTDVSGAKQVGNWIPFSGTYNGKSYLFVGKAGSNRSQCTVTTADLSSVDVWNVSILGTGDVATADNATQAENMFNNLKVTYTSENNLGAPTVGNNGFFLVKKGEIPAVSDLSFAAKNLASQALSTPDVNVDPISRTIYVNFTTAVTPGWHTITLHSIKNNGGRAYATEWTNLATEGNAAELRAIEQELHQSVNGGDVYYGVAIHTADTENSGLHLFYVSPSSTANRTNILSSSGHYVRTDGTAARDNSAAITDLALTAHDELAGVHSAELCIWGTTASGNASTATGVTGSQIPLLGKFSGVHSYFSFGSAPEALNAYKVIILSAPDGANVSADPQVQVNNQANKGLSKLYNGGTIFLAPGAELSVDDVTAPTLNGIEPVITIVDHNVVVDYTIQVSKIDISKSTLTVEAGNTVALSATTDSDLHPMLSWASSDAAVATVNVNGMVKGIAPGTATITVFYGDITAMCQVTVVPAEPTELTFSETTAELKVGEDLEIVATVNPFYSQATNPVVWSSSKPDVAKVEHGYVTALKAGQTVITATCGSLTAECTVTVTGTETAIEAVEVAAPAIEGIYDLQGRRLAHPSKGINIINGRKVLVK